MARKLTMGSLFDGSGGFPLGGLMAGITPVWASEIEPFPIRVTTKRLPFMKHYGDISQMDGGKIEPVDIICFGSPCTDLSVAGRRAGLAGQQSSLFYQAIRIINEMRCATNGRCPRWICWENVPGAFSSNSGRDFQEVLNSIIGVIEPSAKVPSTEKGRWPSADCYLGDRWSVAYRTFDAQYWGVPQRRKRIFLIADFRGQSAWEVLFEPKGLQRADPAHDQSWDDYSANVVGDAANTNGTGKTINSDLICLDYASYNQGVNAKYRPGIAYDLSPTLVSSGPNIVLTNCVRRLTPTECSRLQGFPDWWCSDLGTEDPSEEEIRFWTEVWETHRRIVNPKVKPKTRNQILKWIKQPHSDAAEYKMWGNGVALPCVYFVLAGIVWCTQNRGL